MDISRVTNIARDYADIEDMLYGYWEHIDKSDLFAQSFSVNSKEAYEKLKFLVHKIFHVIKSGKCKMVAAAMTITAKLINYNSKYLTPLISFISKLNTQSKTSSHNCEKKIDHCLYCEIIREIVISIRSKYSEYSTRYCCCVCNKFSEPFTTIPCGFSLCLNCWLTKRLSHEWELCTIFSDRCRRTKGYCNHSRRQDILTLKYENFCNKFGNPIAMPSEESPLSSKSLVSETISGEKAKPQPRQANIAPGAENVKERKLMESTKTNPNLGSWLVDEHKKQFKTLTDAIKSARQTNPTTNLEKSFCFGRRCPSCGCQSTLQKQSDTVICKNCNTVICSMCWGPFHGFTECPTPCLGQTSIPTKTVGNIKNQKDVADSKKAENTLSATRKAILVSKRQFQKCFESLSGIVNSKSFDEDEVLVRIEKLEEIHQVLRRHENVLLDNLLPHTDDELDKDVADIDILDIKYRLIKRKATKLLNKTEIGDKKPVVQTTINSSTSETGNEPKINCCVCLSDVKVIDVVDFGCNHKNCCNDCTKTLFETYIKNGEIKKLICPETECKQPAPKKLIQTLLATEAFEKLNKFWAQNEEERQKMEDEAKMRRKQENEASESFIRRQFKRCPKCNTDIEKIEGCNKMECTRCGTKFCYLCGANISSLQDAYHHFGGNCQLFEVPPE